MFTVFVFFACNQSQKNFYIYIMDVSVNISIFIGYQYQPKFPYLCIPKCNPDQLDCDLDSSENCYVGAATITVIQKFSFMASRDSKVSIVCRLQNLAGCLGVLFIWTYSVHIFFFLLLAI